MFTKGLFRSASHLTDPARRVIALATWAGLGQACRAARRGSGAGSPYRCGEPLRQSRRTRRGLGKRARCGGARSARRSPALSPCDVLGLHAAMFPVGQGNTTWEADGERSALASTFTRLRACPHGSDSLCHVNYAYDATHSIERHVAVTPRVQVARFAAIDANRYLLATSIAERWSDAPRRSWLAAIRPGRAPSACHRDPCHRRSTTAASVDRGAYRGPNTSPQKKRSPSADCSAARSSLPTQRSSAREDQGHLQHMGNLVTTERFAGR